MGAIEQKRRERKKKLQQWLSVLEEALERLERLIERSRETHQMMKRSVGDREKRMTEPTEMKDSEVQTREKNKKKADGRDEWEFGESSQASKLGGTNRSKLKGMETPVDNGEIRDGRLVRTERVAQLQNSKKKGKMKRTVGSFEGAAIGWFRWAHDRGRIRSWAELRRQTLWRFCPSREGTHCVWSLAGRQNTTVAEVRRLLAEVIDESAVEVTDESAVEVTDESAVEVTDERTKYAEQEKEEGESSRQRVVGGTGGIKREKLEMPKLGGHEEESWMFRAEYFF